MEFCLEAFFDSCLFCVDATLHIKQGIFTVEPSLTIHREYSRHLETILDTDTITGKNPLELLLNSDNTSMDDRSRIESSLSVAFDSLTSWNFNRSQLPQELTYGKKSLELDWAAISDKDEQIEKLLVVVRDVSRYKKLELAKKPTQIRSKKIKEGDYVIHERVSPNLSNLIRRILAKDPTNRLDLNDI